VNLPDLLATVAVFALPVLFAITLHEAAHAWVAHRLGDDTAFMLGRVTLNPVKHIDPIGTLLMPLLLYLATSGAFLFGYAKPVPVRINRLRQPRRDMVWVALAGPAANFAQALLWAVALVLLAALGVQERFFLKMCHAGILVNLVMWAFNLFPVPPLDGGRVAVGLLPFKPAQWLARLEPYGFFIVMALVVLGVVSRWWLLPLMRMGYGAIDLVLTPLTALL